MIQYYFHEIDNPEIYGVLSIMDYEATVRSILEHITFPSSDHERSIVVDLALKSGMNEYRFLQVELSKSGKVIWERNAYYKASSTIEQCANSFLIEHAEFVRNSVLPDKTIERILGKAPS